MNELPPETQRLVNELQALVESSLNAAESPHTTAVSWSVIHHDGSPILAMRGGKINVPGRPPLKHDKRLVVAQHRAALESEGGVLSCIVLTAKRPDDVSAWDVQAKLVSAIEYQQLQDARHLIDTEVKEALLAVAPDETWERVSFGKDLPTKDPVVVVKVAGEIDRQAPSSRLLELLAKAQQLYASYALDLQVSYWSLDGAQQDISFREHFE